MLAPGTRRPSWQPKQNMVQGVAPGSMAAAYCYHDGEDDGEDDGDGDGDGEGEGEGEGESIILPLLLIPSWALAIAYRLPIACLSIAYRHGPGPGPMSIGNR